MIQAIEGHYITGYGDRSGNSKMNVLPDVRGDVEQVLMTREDAKARLERVRELIEGFETPYGMELLASVHWLNTHKAITQLADVEPALHTWSKRKTQRFEQEHVAIAWHHLDRLGWLQTTPDASRSR